jgi:hypothetical protein
VEEIKSVITNAVPQDPLYIYIPVYEDPFGKKDTGFGEYAFINFEPTADYYALEALDEIVRLLKEPHTKRLQLLSNDQVWDIKDKTDAEIVLDKGDVVRVISGPLRHNFGTIQFMVGDNANVLVCLGQEFLQVTLPIKHVRKSIRRTLLRKKEIKTPSFDVSNGMAHEGKNPLNFGEMPRMQILRRGPRKTKISIDNKVHQIPNEVIDKILLAYDILDDHVVTEVSKIVLDGESCNGTEE